MCVILAAIVMRRHLAEISTIECLTKVMEVDESPFPSPTLPAEDVFAPPVSVTVTASDDEGTAVAVSTSAAAGAVAAPSGGPSAPARPHTKKRSRKDHSATMSKQLAATLTDAHFTGLAPAATKRYAVADLDALAGKEDVAAALRDLAPAKLPALPPLVANVPRVRQQILMRGHTSYLTFATLWVK